MPVTRDAGLVAELLLLAVTDASAAEVRAAELEASSLDPWLQSVARHARGLAWRQQGDVDRAIAELRAAIRLARRSGDDDRVADVRATLGAALAMAGRTRAGLVQLDRAVADAADPNLRAKVFMRRGYVLSEIVGRHEEALQDLESALDGVRAAGDRIWEARTLNNIGQLHIALGHAGPAEAAVVEAERIFTEEHQEVEASQALVNRGGVAFARGDLPTALRLFDAASRRYDALRMDLFELVLDQSAALLTAGLPDEAAAVVTRRLRRGRLQPIQEADLLLRLASASLAAGQVAAAVDNARAAREAYQRQGRAWFALRAQLAELRAQEASGRTDRRAARAALAVAERLEGERAREAVEAWLLAARLSPERAEDALRHAAAHVGSRLPLMRAMAWLAAALLGEQQNNRATVLRACRRGLAELDTHQARLGSSELRALATAHGSDLARLALRRAVGGRPRELLWWSERWRATALTQPPVRPEGDDPVAGPLAALRDNARRLQTARSEGDDTAQLESERARREDEVRRLTRQAVGHGGSGGDGVVVVDRLVAAAGDEAFVELVEVDDVLHALVVSRGRVRARVVGPVADAERALDFARFTLRQAARGRRVSLADAGERLQTAVLGPDVSRLVADRAVVVSPTSRLHAAPWGLLPVLAGVPHNVVPSGALWLRATARRTSSDHRVFVSGPGLTTGGAEIDVVAPHHPHSVVLRDGSATVDAALAALDGAALAHVAAHGHFRLDAPLFSSLDLDDGPLLVHDFERMTAPPHRVVLSACESGVMAPVGAGELLGLVSALLSVGTAGVVASVVVVNDQATSELMVDLHAGLESGEDLATALLRARRAASDDVQRATAAAFLALGV